MSKRVSVIAVCQSIFWAAMISGCEYRAVIRPSESDTLMLRELHQKLGLNECYVWLDDGRGAVYPPNLYQLVFYSESGESVIIHTRDGYNIPIPVEYYLDPGSVRAELTWSGRNNIKFRVAPFTVSVLRSRIDSTKSGLKTVWASDMEQIHGDGYTIYYDEGGEAVAHEMFELMGSLRQTIENVLGVQPAPFGMALVKERANYVTPDWPKGMPVFSFSQALDLKYERHPIVTVAHEWTEHTLREYLVDDDINLRFAFDGLAELVAADHAEQWYCRKIQSLKSLRHDGVNHVDILNVFLSAGGSISPLGEAEVQAGYPLSHLFWRGIADRHGLSAIKEIVRQWRIQGRLDGDGLIHLVEEITSDSSVYEAIRYADVQEAIADYQRRGWVSTTLDDHIYAHISE